MNKIKQIIMFCLLCVIGMAAEAETIPNNEIWYTISKGGGYVKLNENRYDFGANVISNEYDYKKNIYIIKFDGDVTTIGEGSFYDCKSLASIIIPNSVTSIGETAFEYCSSLTSINIPNSVTSIGNDAFWGCSSLTSINIPNSVTSIGDDAFERCNLTELHITDIDRWAEIDRCYINNHINLYLNNKLVTEVKLTTATKIGKYAFSGCSGLTSIEIPNSVTSIGLSAFDGCSALTSITIPNSVTSIGDHAFKNCNYEV